VGRLSFINRTLERKGLYLYQSVDSWVSPCGRVRAWVFQITYRNVFFMIERYSLFDLNVISPAELFNKDNHCCVQSLSQFECFSCYFYWVWFYIEIQSQPHHWGVIRV
jgi:hypothetical protein